MFVLGHQGGPARQDFAPRLALGSGPGRECVGGGLDRLIHLGGRQLGYAPEQRVIGWAMDLNGVVASRNPLACDQGGLADQRPALGFQVVRRRLI